MKNNLKALRLGLRLTIEDVAETLGIHKNTYRQYENGERNMKPETMIAVAEFFNIPVDEIFLHRLPSRYISVSADEKKLLAQYSTLTPEHQRLIRVILRELSPAGSTLHRSDGTLRMASRTSGKEEQTTDDYLPPEETEDDVPDTL